LIFTAVFYLIKFTPDVSGIDLQLTLNLDSPEGNWFLKETLTVK